MQGGSQMAQRVTWLAAWLVLAAGAAVSLLLWNDIRLRVERDTRSDFNGLVGDVRKAVDGRLLGYYSVLYGLQGLFRAGPAVDREAFRRYVDSIIPTHLSRGIRSFSYAERVSAADRPRYEARARAEGRPEFAIHPPGEREEYLVVHHIEPFSFNSRGLGLDIAAEPVPRAAFERARDTGMLAATGGLRLVAAPATPDPGVSLRLALYRPEAQVDSVAARREALTGVVSATFHVSDLVSDLLWNASAQGLQLRIFDSGEIGATERDQPPQQLFASSELASGAQDFTEAVTLDVGGRQWRLHFSAPKAAFRSTAQTWAPWLALTAALLISGLLSALVGSLAGSGRRAQHLAERITGDLRHSEARLAQSQRQTQEMIEALPNPIFFKSTDGRYLGVNKAWERMFGIGREAFIGKTVHDLYPRDPEVADRLHMMDQALWRQPGSQIYEMPITTPDGVRHETIYYKATFTSGDGEVAGLIGTIIDITDRKQAEKRLAMEHAVTRVLTEADSAAAAMPNIIRLICESMEWQCGARWIWDRQARLFRCAETWGVADPVIAHFLQTIASRTVAAGSAHEGLIRRAFATGKPAWITDVAGDPSFVRAPLVIQAGLQGGFAFPLLIGSEVLGAMEFFHRDAREPDEALRQIAQSIGSQIGQFLVRKQAEEAVRFVATHDSLTGLPNRMMFTQRLEHAIHQARRHGRRLAILFIDLDRFKLINDTLGHEAGDTLLRAVALRLRETLRESDTVGRLGGDEFVVLLEEISDPLYVGSVAQKLIDALARSFVLAGHEYHVSASIGVGAFPDDADSMPDLLKNADIAMYRAKDHGRGSFQFYSEQMNVHSVERLALESELRRALDRDGLVLHFQPQLAIGSGRITGAEALVRWRHPELGLLPPGRFIPLAEECGLIVPIGEWVLRTACERCRAWRDAGLALPRISVNLSSRQFLHGDLTRSIERVLAQTGCAAGALELEITESMVMHNPERAATLMREIRRMGVKVAIDDFGTGYSSLAALKRFPIENLKVDRSFIQGIPDDRSDTAITEAIIVMAHSLGMKVIAEGVETREQLDFLRAHGCDEMQGYYFSHPLAEPELLAFVRQTGALRKVN